MSNPILINFAGKERDFSNAFSCRIEPHKEGAIIEWCFFNGNHQSYAKEEFANTALCHERRQEINKIILEAKQNG